MFDIAWFCPKEEDINVPQNKKRYGGKKIKTEFFIKWAGVLHFLRTIVPLLLVASLFIAISFGIRAMILNVPYFMVKEIRITKGKLTAYNTDAFKKHELLKKVKGESIFKVNIEKIAVVLKKEHPEFKTLKVNRIMPNIIGLELEVRVPLVMVKYNNYYPVDSDGVLLSPDTKVDGTLPVIIGLEFLKKPKVGEKVESKQLKSVLQAYKILRSANVIKKYGIKGIEVSNIKNLVIYLGNNLEVRIGEGKLADELKKLENVLKDSKVDKNNLRYVDLRFEDVVLGTR